MSRFKTSKFKNAFSHVSKKEFWVNDLHVGSDLRGSGTHIAASEDYMAFIHDSKCVGGIAVLPLSSHGRFSQFPTLGGHAGVVTDFKFSPFHSDLMASGGEDSTVKMWQLSEPLAASSPVSSLGPLDSAVEVLEFHPAADNLLAVASGKSVKVWDINREVTAYDLGGFPDVVQSVSWQRGAGQRIAAMCKTGREKQLSILDPRSGQPGTEVKVHSGAKGSQVVWLGDSNMLVTAGFSSSRNAELALWDLTNMSKPLTKISSDSTSGSPMMFYDEDTKMLFVAMKSESKMVFYELIDKSPYLSQGNDVFRASDQTKGMAMLPKRALQVLSCQVACFLQLTQSAVVPVGYYVQRKAKNEFHDDLFPDTAGPVPALSGEQWCSGENATVAKVSLNPSKRVSKDVSPAKPPKKSSPSSSSTPVTSPSSSLSPPPPSATPTSSGEPAADPVRTPSPRVANIVRSSKYRHISGQLLHRSCYIERFPSLSSTVPGDSNAFQANKDRVAVALSIAGAQIGVFELSKPGRLDKGTVPTIQNVSSVMDFTFDPFDNTRLVVACEDARIKVWSIPRDGLSETLSEPGYCLIGHQEKANVLAFHPQASSLLASAGYDCRILLWDLTSREVAIELDPLPQPLFAMAWSPDGTQLATLCKDRVLRLYTPRSSTSPTREGSGPEGSRGARLVWLDDNTLVVSGFGKSSSRTLSLYSIESLDKPKTVLPINVSPATLIPYFDPDTNLLYLSGKGDSTVLVFEYTPNEDPYLFEVAPFSCKSGHQAIVFLPKVHCDVKAVEIAKGIRLTKATVEQFVIKVPRTRTTYFQDDIYPPTTVTWTPALTAGEWLAGKNGKQSTVDLKPDGMKPLSEAPAEAPAKKKFASFNPDIKTDEQRKEELLTAMIHRMGDQDEEALPQTTMDGCDSDEWSD